MEGSHSGLVRPSRKRVGVNNLVGSNPTPSASEPINALATAPKSDGRKTVSNVRTTGQLNRLRPARVPQAPGQPLGPEA